MTAVFGGKTEGLQTGNRLLWMTLAGIAGGFVGFLVSEAVDLSEASTEQEMRVLTGVWFMVVILGIGAGLIGGNALLQRSVPATEALLLGGVALLVGGFIAGFIAQEVYSSMLDEAAIGRCFDRNSGFESCLANAIRPARAVGWTIAGAIGGAGVGAAFRSWKRVQNGAIGGAIGGLIGGLLFDSIGLAFSGGNGAVARMIAIILIGALMGLLISFIDTARTSIFLEVISGEMKGRQFLVMDNRTTVGSARSAAVPLLADRTIKEVHLVIESGGSQPRFSCSTAENVLLNGTSVSEGALSHGDILTIGCTEVRVGFRKATLGSTPGDGSGLGRQTITTQSGASGTPPNSSVGADGYQGRPTARQALGDMSPASGDGSAPPPVGSPATPAPPPASGPARQRPRLPTKPQQ